MDNVYIARQPIFDSKRDLFGYELLFRDAGVSFSNITDQDLAFSQVITNSFLNIGMENLVGSSNAFINLPRAFIVDKQMLPMTSEQVAFEIMGSVGQDEAIIDGLKFLSQQGYVIVLDDFIFNESHEPLLSLANLVKIDVANLSEVEILSQIELLKNYSVKIIAKKVDTQEQYLLCQKIGFDYFQGFYFCRPNVIKGKNVAINKPVVFQLIGKLQDHNITMEELEKVLIQDVILSYKLMRYINSASYSLRKEIESIKQALIIIGMKDIRNWANLVILSNINTDKPHQLITTALVRAKMAAQLAELKGAVDKDQMFTVGLFSLLDAIMDVPMIELLDTISLIAPIKMALLDGEGELGVLLKQVIDYEQGNWGILEKNSIDPKIYNKAYLNAVRWADETSHALQS